MKQNNLSKQESSTSSGNRAMSSRCIAPGYFGSVPDLWSGNGPYPHCQPFVWVLNKATAYRLLSNLRRGGYVERSPADRKYRLGFKVFELGSYFQSQLEVRRLGLAFLREIVDQVHEAAFLCIREVDEALCVERVESIQEVNIFSLRVGGKQPLHCGGAPRALLVGLDDQGIERIRPAHRVAGAYAKHHYHPR